MILTDEEKKELARCPVDVTQYMTFTIEQLRLRQQIADKLCLELNSGKDPTLTSDVAEIYVRFPQSRFYTDRETETSIYRIYGVLVYENGEYGVHVSSCHINWTNDVIGGVPIEDIKMIEQWNSGQLARIQMNNAPG